MGDPAVSSFVEEYFRDLPEVIGVKELANKLGRTRGTVYRWLRDRDLPVGFPVAGQWVIWKAEVIEYFEARLEENRAQRHAAASEVVALGDLELPEDEQQ